MENSTKNSSEARYKTCFCFLLEAQKLELYTEETEDTCVSVNEFIGEVSCISYAFILEPGCTVRLCCKEYTNV